MHRADGTSHRANGSAWRPDGRPNQRADQLLAVDGARTAAVNTDGGVSADRGARIERFARFLPVGFYYKTFIGRRLFPAFESLIRRVSGLGQIEAGRATAPRKRGG